MSWRRPFNLPSVAVKALAQTAAARAIVMAGVTFIMLNSLAIEDAGLLIKSQAKAAFSP